MWKKREKATQLPSNSECIENPDVIHINQNYQYDGESGLRMCMHESLPIQRGYDQSMNTADLSSFTAQSTPSSIYSNNYLRLQPMTLAKSDNDHGLVRRFSSSSFYPLSTSNKYSRRECVLSQTRRRDGKVTGETHVSKRSSKRRSTLKKGSSLVRCISFGELCSQEEENPISYDDFTHISTESSRGHSSLSSLGLDENNFEGINFSHLSNRFFHYESEDSSIVFSDTDVILGKKEKSRKKVPIRDDEFLSRGSTRNLLRSFQCSVPFYCIIVLVFLSFFHASKLRQATKSLGEMINGRYLYIPSPYFNSYP